jgi:hypothetical protein
MSRTWHFWSRGVPSRRKQLLPRSWGTTCRRDIRVVAEPLQRLCPIWMPDLTSTCNVCIGTDHRPDAYIETKYPVHSESIQLMGRRSVTVDRCASFPAVTLHHYSAAWEILQRRNDFRWSPLILKNRTINSLTSISRSPRKIASQVSLHFL